MRLLLILSFLSLSLSRSLAARMCVNFFFPFAPSGSFGSLGRPSLRVWPSFSSYSWSFRVRVVAGPADSPLGQSPKGREQQKPSGDKQKYDPTWKGADRPAELLSPGVLKFGFMQDQAPARLPRMQIASTMTPTTGGYRLILRNSVLFESDIQLEIFDSYGGGRHSAWIEPLQR